MQCIRLKSILRQNLVVLNDVLAQMQLNEQKSVSVKVQEFSQLVETYLAKGGVVGNISEAVREVELNKSLRMRSKRVYYYLQSTLS